jgi:hypothetical protein
MTDNEIWMFWCNRPAVEEGEDDSMEAELVSTVRRILAASKQPARKALTDEDCARIYNEANDITTKNPPLTTARIFTAMRAAHGINGSEG